MANSAPSSSDMLSNLPEHLLLHILSFLPTKTAVKTSVLSKPWQHLWTLVPAIDLDDSRYSRRGTFEDRVSKVLDSYKEPVIRRFRLRGRYSTCVTSLDKWVSYATQRNVEELDLQFNLKKNATFVFHCDPQPCKTLVTMKVIVYGRQRFLIGDIYLPTLKSLHINTSEFETLDPSLSGFFSSRFPLLEELIVQGGDFHHNVNISLPMLRRLEINNRYFKYAMYTLNLDAPSLQYLVLHNFRSGDFHAEILPNLVEANVDICNIELRHEDGDHGESLINFLNALSNVRMLNLSLQTMKGLFNASFHSLFHADRFQPFRNLVKLDLHLHLLGVTMIMLSKFENLEHLTIIEYDRYWLEDRMAPPTPTHVPNCLTYRLKTFCFRNFQSSKHGIEFAVYILKNSLVLESAKIMFRPVYFGRRDIS